MSHARAWYRCHTAVYTAKTLDVQDRPHSVLEFGIHSEINITTGFGSFFFSMVVPWRTSSVSTVLYFTWMKVHLR